MSTSSSTSSIYRRSLMQYVSVQQQVEEPHPHPRELSNIVTVSQLSYCKVTHLQHCDGTPRSLDLLPLYVSHTCETENVGTEFFFFFFLLDREGKQKEERERQRKSVCKTDRDTDASFGVCVCNVYLFDANSGVQSIPLI